MPLSAVFSPTVILTMSYMHTHILLTHIRCVSTGAHVSICCSTITVLLVSTHSHINSKSCWKAAPCQMTAASPGASAFAPASIACLEPGSSQTGAQTLITWLCHSLPQAQYLYLLVLSLSASLQCKRHFISLIEC